MINEKSQTENNNENILIWSEKSKNYFCNIYAKNKNENIEKDIEIHSIIHDVFIEKTKDDNNSILRVSIDSNCINLNIEGFDNSKSFDTSLKKNKFINLKRIIGKKDLFFVRNPRKFLEYNLERLLETFTGHKLDINLHGSFKTPQGIYS